MYLPCNFYNCTSKSSCADSVTNMRAVGKNHTGNMAPQIPVNKKIPASKLDNPAIIKDLMRTNDEINPWGHRFLKFLTRSSCDSDMVPSIASEQDYKSITSAPIFTHHLSSFQA